MPIEFRCPQCEKLLRTPDGTSGRQAKCPQCGALTTIPEATAASRTAGDPLADLPQMSPAAPPSAPNPFQSPAAQQMRATPEFEIRRGFQPTRIDLADVMGRTWRIYKANLGKCVGAGMLVLLLSYAITGGAAYATSDSPMAVRQLTNALCNIPTMWLTIGLFIFLLKVSRGESAPFADVFSGGPFLLKAIGINILFVIALTIGLLLLIIPFFIVLTMFSPAFLVLIDQGVGVLDSFRMSREATQGNKLTLFALLWLNLAIVALVTLLTCGLGFFLVQPFSMLLYVVCYLVMTGQSTADGQA